MIKFSKKKYFFLTLFFLSVINCFANDIVINNDSKRKLIGKDLEIVISKDNSPNNLNFQSNKQNLDVPNIGTISENVWCKFVVVNNSSSKNIFIDVDYPILDEVELISIDSNGIWNKQLLGERNSFSSRIYLYPNYIFNLNIPINTKKEFFLRVKSKEQIILPIYISNGDDLWFYQSQESIINGLYLGVILIMFIYNLFVYFSVRDKSYLYYVIYIIFVGLTQLSIKGYTFQYLWPNSPAFSALSPIIFACLSGIGAILVTKSFLHTKQHSPKFDYFLSFQILIFLLALGLTLVDLQKAFVLMQLSTTITTLSILYISCALVIKKYSQAILFFVAWIILVIGAVVFLLKDFGVLPYNNFTSYAMQIASAVEMALLSLALADRINILKKEKEASQAEALAAAKENERIITQQNIILEQKVEERTGELVKANIELGDTLEDLKQAQTQLVESEKMASLGQLTAGIAHEINNPINFVTSNVAPLQRDVDILFNAIEYIENVSLSEKNVTDKQQSIENYKEELDFDYLKIEIKHLLKGITEGASRTAEIVRGLRIFSRVDEDDLKSANINEGMDSTLTIIKNRLTLNNIRVQTQYGKFPNIDCYPGKLNQVFLNIISNSIDALKSKADGERIIKIQTESDGKKVFIKISDNGMGMDEMTKQKIFEPFFTTKEVGEGTGLGMSIVYNTIKKHLGEVLINSELNKGTETIIIIPVSHKNL